MSLLPALPAPVSCWLTNGRVMLLGSTGHLMMLMMMMMVMMAMMTIMAIMTIMTMMATMTIMNNRLQAASVSFALKILKIYLCIYVSGLV